MEQVSNGLLLKQLLADIETPPRRTATLHLFHSMLSPRKQVNLAEFSDALPGR